MTSMHSPSNENKEGRLFIGIFPAAISYADKQREEYGDYKRLALLPYRSLELIWFDDVPPELAGEIQEHAATIIAKRGELFEISSSGQTVMLGE